MAGRGGFGWARTQPKKEEPATAIPGNANAIHKLVMANDMDGLQELLDTCPDGINALDSRGRSPIHLACEKGYFDMAQELANSGADCRVLTSPEGLTALHLMAKSVIDEDNMESALQTADLIVECGVDVDSMPLPGQAGRNYILMTTNIDPTQTPLGMALTAAEIEEGIKGLENRRQEVVERLETAKAQLTDLRTQRTDFQERINALRAK